MLNAQSAVKLRMRKGLLVRLVMLTMCDGDEFQSVNVNVNVNANGYECVHVNESEYFALEMMMPQLYLQIVEMRLKTD
jgi:hypothetical protein